MILSKHIKQFLCGSIVFPLSNTLIKRKGIMALYRNALKMQNTPQELIKEIQLQKFQNIIHYAYTSIPFYQKRFASIGLQPGDITCLEDIKNIPPLTHDDLIDYREKLVISGKLATTSCPEGFGTRSGESLFTRFNNNKNIVIHALSRSNSASPSFIYEDGVIAASNWAQELRLRKWYNVKQGAKEVRLAKEAPDAMPNSSKESLRDILWNQLILPGVNLSEFDFRTNYHKISNYKPEVLWGYTSSLTSLAEYMQNNNLIFSTWKPKLCITWGAPLYENDKDLLESIFHCQVTNIYSAKEIGHIAGLCPHGSMHINQDTFYVENENSSGALPGSNNGELLVTTLEQTSMPFIRYTMGDIGIVGESECACGMNFQVLKNLHGHTKDMFVTKDGSKISEKFWLRAFMNKNLAGAIKRFQVKYTKKGDIKIKLVKHKNYTHKTEQILKKYLKDNLHSDTNISLVFNDTSK